MDAMEDPTQPDAGDSRYAIVQPGKTFFERVDGTYVEWYCLDLHTTGESVQAELTRGEAQATVDADELGTALQDDTGRWVTALYDGENDKGEPTWVPHPQEANTGTPPEPGRESYEAAEGPLQDVDVDLRTAPDRPSELTFERICGRGSQTEINNFLEGGRDGLVKHTLGGVGSWKAGFVARSPDGAIVSALTLHHYNPSTNGVEIAITRLANHPCAPHNTSSWMIGKVRKWAARAKAGGGHARDEPGHGYERLATYAGVGANEGVCYQGAGMTPAGEPAERDSVDWYDDDGEGGWARQKYVSDLNPDDYADKSTAWADETVTDRVNRDPARA